MQVERKTGSNINDAASVAEDREQWRKILRTANPSLRGTRVDNDNYLCYVIIKISLSSLCRYAVWIVLVSIHTAGFSLTSDHAEEAVK